jgi:hypothetical protein
MTIEVESLNKMFERHNNNANHRSYGNKCCTCGCDAEVVITKTAGGYGFQGGVLYEPDPQNFLILCGDCYKPNKII